MDCKTRGMNVAKNYENCNENHYKTQTHKHSERKMKG